MTDKGFDKKRDAYINLSPYKKFEGAVTVIL